MRTKTKDRRILLGEENARHERAHKLAQEELSISVTLLSFDGSTFGELAFFGKTPADRRRIRKERAEEKKRLKARLVTLSKDRDYIDFDPYGA